MAFPLTPCQGLWGRTAGATPPLARVPRPSLLGGPAALSSIRPRLSCLGERKSRAVV